MQRRVIAFLAALAVFVGACDSAEFGSAPVEVQIAELLDTAGPLSDSLTLNPSGRTPLAAELSVATNVPTTVSFTVLGERPFFKQFDDLASAHSFPILGLYPGVENEVVVELIAPSTNQFSRDTLRITTPALPESFPAVEILTATESAMEPGWNLSNLSIGDAGQFKTYPLIFDEDGAIRWYLDLSDLGDTNFLIRRLANGNWLGGFGPGAYEYDMLGRTLNEWEFPGYWYHHDIVEKPDGNFIVAVDKAGLDTVEDHVIEIDRGSGATVREWDLRQVLDIDRFDLIENERDWFHMNAVWYDPADDALIISGRNQGLVKVDGDNNLVWILAPHKGWGKAGLDGEGFETSGYLLTAVDANGVPYGEDVQLGLEDAPDFSWVWGQHAPMLLDNGNLFAFDNGLTRNFGASPPMSRGVEYAINEAAMTVRQVWEYGSERGAAYYSGIISDVDVLPTTGNRLIMPGFVAGAESYAHVTEVTYPGKSVVFDAQINFTNLNNTGDGWGQIDIVYRSERLPLYPPQVGSVPASEPMTAARQLDSPASARPNRDRSL